MTTGGQKVPLSGTGFLFNWRGSGKEGGSYVDGADTISDPGSYTTTRRRARTGVLVIPRNGWHTGRQQRGIKHEWGSWLYRGTARNGASYFRNGASYFRGAPARKAGGALKVLVARYATSLSVSLESLSDIKSSLVQSFNSNSRIRYKLPLSTGR
ncbi:hypothetical protein R3P38DRAFT_3201973 [Favolaschia claudopus]|uniref:Uncharacterized protein n=1 Tax=Favolaschia claudopus TaxID=2862362 RepID=A0AAW0AVF2_9AGAR